jgi:hypothetical protein
MKDERMKLPQNSGVEISADLVYYKYLIGRAWR